ncbi:hypothetical protein [Anaerolactibacter massiliensis]|uniref:hypothetical protein n=1 Tax=Anaerolactibacter massiliensis TaxID=2044573 RepID=UPI000CF876E0|nr:hypothetical protein [Anaerolactibacter massiliensis]
MAVKQGNSRISVLLDVDEWSYLDIHACWEGKSKSRYLEDLLRQDMAKREMYDDPEFILKEIQCLLSRLKPQIHDLEVSDG